MSRLKGFSSAEILAGITPTNKIRGVVTESLKNDPTILCRGLVLALDTLNWSVNDCSTTDGRAFDRWKRLSPHMREHRADCRGCAGTGNSPHGGVCWYCDGKKENIYMTWTGKIRE